MSNTRPRMKSLMLLAGLGLLALMTATLLGPVPAPASAAGPAKEPSVSAGAFHTCAVTTASRVQCWGSNFSGELGDGTNTQSLSPVDVCAGGALGCTQPLIGVAALSAGFEYTCALTTAGGVKCWGENGSGQLGNGAGADSATPVDVVGLTSGVAAVSAGFEQTCALTTVGGVKCWGSNDSGQLGNGATADSATPVDVVGLTTGAAAVAAGSGHACAVMAQTGGVKCWGSNYYGQLGATTTETCPPGPGPGFPCSTTPVDACAGGLQGCAQTLTGVAAISGGDGHTCALTQVSGVKCWGYNGYGQLGNGTMTDSPTPVDVVGLTTGVAAVAAGLHHNCALTTAAGLKCWGLDYFGSLGVGPTTGETCYSSMPCSTTPLDVCTMGATPPCTATSSNALAGLLAVDAGYGHTCAVIKLGLVMCWGPNDFGQLGNGMPVQRNGPVNVAGLSASGAAIAAGGQTACARTTAGGLRCWGDNRAGQLGDGQQCGFTCPAPVDVAGLITGVASVAGGYGYNCAVTEEQTPGAGGGVKCWGDNRQGTLGNNTTTASTIPVEVCAGGPQGCTQTLTGVAAVAAARGVHACAVMAQTGGVKCWGDNGYGQLGATTTETCPPGPTVPCSTTPVDVCAGGPQGCTQTLIGVAAISAGGEHTCALTQASGVKCWGYNGYGQLGNGTTTDSPTPVDVVGLTTGVAAVAAGLYHTCAVMGATGGGGIKCWGSNAAGQLGATTTKTCPVDPPAPCSTTPMDVCAGGLQGCTQTLTGVAAAAGWAHTCAVTTVGGVKCWGAGYSGQLGDGTATQQATPVDVLGLGSDVTAVALGGGHSCAVIGGAGGVRCWGDDRDGQLGIGVGGFSSTPVQGAVVGTDTDRDGLLDDWETNGIDYNGDTTVDFVLPGANPNHKDIYVEVDWMATSSHTHDPDNLAIDDVTTAFNNVPNALLNNPDGQPGITLHVIQDERVCLGGVGPACTGGTTHFDSLPFDRDPNQTDFGDIKAANFGTAAERSNPNSANILGGKRLAYHYAIFGHRNAEYPQSSGIADLPGNDFFVTLGAFASGIGTRDQQAGTFMHELGHNLSLRHGGGDSVDRKPNYLSVMNYSFQFPTPCSNRPLDYSRAALPPGAGVLDENNLSEPAGIGGPPGSCTAYYDPSWPQIRTAAGDRAIDWNGNGNPTDTGVAVDINRDGSKSILMGYNDWANLLYDFRPSPSFAPGVYDTGGEAPDQPPPDPVAGVTEITMGRCPASGCPSIPTYVPSVVLVKGGDGIGPSPCSAGEADATTDCLYVWAKHVDNTTGAGAFEVKVTYDASLVHVDTIAESQAWLASTGRSVSCSVPTITENPVTGADEAVVSCNTLPPPLDGPNCPNHCDGLLAILAFESTGTSIGSTVFNFSQSALVDTAGVAIPATVRSVNVVVAKCADFTGPSGLPDGTIRVNDILYVVNHYFTPDADLDGDGTTRVNDILIAVNEYFSNCTQ